MVMVNITTSIKLGEGHVDQLKSGCVFLPQKLGSFVLNI